MIARLSPAKSTIPNTLRMSSYRKNYLLSFFKSAWHFTPYVIILYCLIVLQGAMAAPVANVEVASSESTSLPTVDHSIVTNFRSQVEEDGSSKVYIDRLSPEEVAVHRRTGRLPKRTMQLIEKLLKAQVPLENHNDTTSSSSVGAIDLLEELFKKSSHRP